MTTLFRGSRDTAGSHCEKCGAYSPIRQIVEVDGEKKHYCTPCASKVPLPKMKRSEGKPSVRMELKASGELILKTKEGKDESNNS